MTLKILFIVPYAPNLIRVRPYNLIRSLSLRGHQVTLATLWTDPDELDDLERMRPYCRQIHAFPLKKWRSYWNCLAALPTSAPLQSVFCWQPEMVAFLQALIGSADFDVVHVEHLRGARYGLALLPGLSAALPPVVWDSVDSISHLFRQSSQDHRVAFSRWLTRFELGRTERYEARLMRSFQRLMVTSPVDKEAFLALSDGEIDPERIFVLHNGVDLSYFAPDEAVEREPQTLVVSGKLSYHANVSMVTFLVQEIMPHVWKSRPEARLMIVGKDPPREIRAFGEQRGITVTGTVKDIRPYLLRAAVAVAPVVYGAGIQNKVLEAMACGTPVVSTPRAVLALSARPGEDLLVEREPERFAQAVVSILKDSDQQCRLGAAGRRYVEKYHDWNVIAGQLEGVYRRAIAAQNLTPANL